MCSKCFCHISSSRPDQLVLSIVCGYARRYRLHGGWWPRKRAKGDKNIFQNETNMGNSKRVTQTLVWTWDLKILYSSHAPVGFCGQDSSSDLKYSVLRLQRVFLLKKITFCWLWSSWTKSWTFESQVFPFKAVGSTFWNTDFLNMNL